MTEATASRFHYVYSCDLHVNLQIKVGTLEGKIDRPCYNELIEDPMMRFSGLCQENCSDFYVTCQVFADSHPLALPVRTCYKAFSTRWNWNEWLTLPLKFSDLPRTAQLAFTIWDIYGPREMKPIGGTTISVFSKYGTLRQGMHDLKVWPNLEADGSSPTTTAGKTSGKQDEMSRLSKLSRKHRNGHMLKVDWLDRLTFREIEMIAEKQKRDSNFMYLMIEFPRIHLEGIDYAVVYFETGGDDVFHIRAQAEIVTVPDPEIQLENLVEHKHHRLARSLRSGPADRDLKPNAATRDQLNTIVGYPPTKALTSEEKDLVWKFRFYLSSQKKALTKYLKSVSWNVPQEAKQALDLLAKWSPMDVEDALELLSPNPAFAHPDVRRYAVTRLQQADDEELLLYLLQLVQALKYEDFDEIQAACKREHEDSATGLPLPPQPSTPGKEPLTPTEEAPPGGRQPSLSAMPQGEMSVSPQTLLDALGLDPSAGEEEDMPSIMGSQHVQMDLATFLITRAWHCKNFHLANYLFWYLKVECDDQEAQLQKMDSGIRDMYITMLKRFSNYALRQPGTEFRLRRAAISAQGFFMDKIVFLVKMVARESGNRMKKIEKLQSQLRDPDAGYMTFDPLYLPLDPEVMIKGIMADKASLFKSALMPCRFNFETTDGGEYVTIFKHGDDLRQDQLILQITTLMDKLLRKENLDLRLTPYKVLATSSRNGFVQFVDSIAVAEVVEKHDSILNYLRKHAPAENTPLGVAPEVIDNYVKSCAGYCVVTYLLGVGDRHLDNLLLTKNGRLFHIDFGYILGRDPKPMPPPMKLSKEIVEAMGGTGSEYFADFKQLCYTAFLHLRRSANLILNLFSLMVDANIPDIALEPDKTVKKVQDKFRLDLTDEEAVQYMQSLIDASVTATVAAFMEQMHKLAQYWRK